MDVCITANEFAAFNQKLFYNENLPVDTFNLPEDIDTAKITAKEVQNVL